MNKLLIVFIALLLLSGVSQAYWGMNVNIGGYGYPYGISYGYYSGRSRGPQWCPRERDFYGPRPPRPDYHRDRWDRGPGMRGPNNFPGPRR